MSDFLGGKIAEPAGFGLHWRAEGLDAMNFSASIDWDCVSVMLRAFTICQKSDTIRMAWLSHMLWQTV